MGKIFAGLIGLAVLAASVPAYGQDRDRDASGLAPPSAEDIPIALMLDLSGNQTLLSREADRRFVPASITKVMTALTAFQMLESGQLVPNQRMPVTDATFEEWSGKGSSMFVPRGASIPVDQLLMGITTVSANDGSVVLAQGASGSVAKWVEQMNAEAQSIGMRDSRFGTPNGWPDAGFTFTTAQDLVTLAKAILTQHPSKFRRYFGHRGMEFNGIAQSNHDPISGIVKGADGFKTGFTNQAGYGFLGTAERNGRRLVMVVAGAERSSIRDRAARDFLEWGFNGFESRMLLGRGEQIGKAVIQDGKAKRVGLATRGPVRIAVPTGGEAGVTLSVVYRGPVPAPVAEGEEIAKLRIEVDGLPPTHVPLVASSAVEQADPWTRVTNAFAGLFS